MRTIIRKWPRPSADCCHWTAKSWEASQTGSALLEAAQRLQPDVVVLDVNLPNVHGLEACRQITQAHPEIKVIIFTAMSGPEVSQLSFAAGASAFVSKLAFANDLLATIMRLCPDRS